jgi:TetR/AcrR family transcriptional regulator, mexJK operon transcriptional repressor
MYICVKLDERPPVTATRRGRPTHAEAKQLHMKLRKAAVATFLEFGYDATTMDTIARAAGTTRRTLYARYPDKRAVFLDVIPWALTRRTERGAGVGCEDTDLVSALTAIGRGAIARALDADTLRLTRIAMNESARFPEFAISAHSMNWSARQREVMDLLQLHREAGVIDVDDLELAAGHFIAMVEHLPTRLAECGIYRTPEEEERHLRHAVRLFVRGISCNP